MHCFCYIHANRDEPVIIGRSLVAGQGCEGYSGVMDTR